MLNSFSATFNVATQGVVVNTPLTLSSTNPNRDLRTFVISDTNSEEAGIRVEKAGVYQIRYTMTIVLSGSPERSEAARFFLTLNHPANVIPDSETEVHLEDVLWMGEVELSSRVLTVDLSAGDLIQITPTKVLGNPTVTEAVLTIFRVTTVE